MSYQTVGITVIFRRDLAANWTTINPILNPGEPGFELDTGLIKLGDGVSTWSSLPYYSGAIIPPDPTVVRRYIDTGGSDQTIDIKTYNSIKIFKKASDLTAGTITPVDSTPRTVPALSVDLATGGVWLVLNTDDNVWYREG